MGISTAIEKAGYTGKIDIGMDVAASEFFREGKYDLDFKNPTPDPTTFIEHQKLADLYQEFIKEFPIVSIEDPFDQDDWNAWTEFTAKTSIQIVGDDITVKSQTYSHGCGEESVQLPALEGESNRNSHRIHRSSPTGQGFRLGHHGLSPFWRNRRLVHC